MVVADDFVGVLEADEAEGRLQQSASEHSASVIVDWTSASQAGLHLEHVVDEGADFDSEMTDLISCMGW